MTTIELEAQKAMLARELLNVDSKEFLDKLERFFRRHKKVEAKAKENLTPYTMEELNTRIDAAEAEINAGIPGIPHEEVMNEMRKLIAAS